MTKVKSFGKSFINSTTLKLGLLFINIPNKDSKGTSLAVQ